MASVERRPSGKWRVRFRHQGKSTGRDFLTEKAARRWAGAVNAHGVDIALAILDNEAAGTTVAAQVARHIDTLTGIEEGTRLRYRDYLRRDIETHPLGHMPLERVTEESVRVWVNSLGARLSGKSVKNVHSLLSASLTNAVRSGDIPTNVAKGVRLPKTMRQEMVFLTQPEFQRIVELTPEHYRPLVMLLGSTGMRIGEATALHVGDVDLDARRIRIIRAWKHTGTAERRIGLPKTSKSRRTIAFPPALLPTLQGLVEGRKAGAWLLTNTHGDPVIPKSFHDNPWTQTVSAFAGDDGRRPRVHDLRHSFASWAISSGHSLPVLQRHLGHESIQTTVDTYGHLQRADLDAMAGVVTISFETPAAIESGETWTT